MVKIIRILITNDSAPLREEWKQILSQHFPEIEYGEAADSEAALQTVRAENWDVLLLDIDVPGRGGFETLKEMKQTGRRAPVIIFGKHPEKESSIRALKLGACGYLRQENAGSELVRSVECALRGSHYIARSLDSLLTSARPDPLEVLSDREFQVMRLLASGKTVKEAAGRLGLGVKTVSSYRTRILKKTGLQNNSQITRYAASLEPDDSR
jgi:DNA-binding NarL/FixJ family response regulator